MRKSKGEREPDIVSSEIGLSKETQIFTWSKASDVANLSVDQRHSLRQCGIPVPSEEDLKKRKEEMVSQALPVEKFTIELENTKGEKEVVHVAKVNLQERLRSGLLLRIRENLLILKLLGQKKFW